MSWPWRSSLSLILVTVFGVFSPPLNDASGGGGLRSREAVWFPSAASPACVGLGPSCFVFLVGRHQFAAVKLCSHMEVFPCQGKGAGRYPLTNVKASLLEQGCLRSAKPQQVQELPGKPGRWRGVPSASCETGSHAGMEEKPHPLEPPSPPASIGVRAQGQAAEAWGAMWVPSA